MNGRLPAPSPQGTDRVRSGRAATGGGITKEDSVETNVPFVSGMFTLLLLVIVGLGMRREMFGKAKVNVIRYQK
jgi:hypothetical protein